VNENRGLTGKIAIVFGGSRGIGAAAARRLAKEGADVTLTYVSTPERAADTVAAIEATGRRGLAIKADSADPAAIKAAVAQTVDHFGKLDIAVVNAGILLRGDVATVNVDDLDVNSTSTCVGSFSPRRGGALLTVVGSLPSAATQQCEADIRARAFTNDEGCSCRHGEGIAIDLAGVALHQHSTGLLCRHDG
jgi:3-oxoacyl-[acyl-carrier protein] reductase